MKCDLKQVEHREGVEVYIQCSRARVSIMKTRYGRLGLCKECFIFVKAALAEKVEKGEVVELESGAKGRKAPEQTIWLRRGQVVVAKLPSAAAA